MDTTTATLVGLGILAVVVIFFFIRFGGKGRFRIKTKFGEANAQGENPPPPAAVPAGVKIRDAEAGRDLRAHSTSPGGVELEKVKAKGHIEASNSPGDSPPKR
jgi:hypothetical protein